MALSAEIVKLLNDFAESQPALRLPTEPWGKSNPKLGDALSGAITEAQTAGTDAAAAAVAGAPRLTTVSVDYTDLSAAGTGVAALLGTAIPDAAIIKKVWYEVTDSFVGDGDNASTVKMGLEDQDDDVAAAAALSSWAAGLDDGIQDGSAANMLKLTADRQLAVTWTAGGSDTDLTAGHVEVYIEWTPGV